MKKFVFTAVLLFFTALLTCGCASIEKEADFDEETKYIGFSDVDISELTVEAAERRGYVVRKNLETIANENVWDDFIAKSYESKDAFVRLALFYDEGTFLLDIYYSNGYFYMYDSSAENGLPTPYKYLLSLEGRWGNPETDSGVVVLTDDDTLTFDEVTKSMVSSSIAEINSVSPHKIVMFFTP